MTSRDFCFWLQGFLEMTPEGSTIEGANMGKLRAHLNLVFAHEIDPSMGDKLKQDALNKIHNKPPTGDLLPRC